MDKKLRTANIILINIGLILNALIAIVLLFGMTWQFLLFAAGSVICLTYGYFISISKSSNTTQISERILTINIIIVAGCIIAFAIAGNDASTAGMGGSLVFTLNFIMYQLIICAALGISQIFYVREQIKAERAAKNTHKQEIMQEKP